MRLDRHKVNVLLAVLDKRQADIVKAGVPRGTLSGAMLENRISERTAERIAKAIGCKTAEILKDERK